MATADNISRRSEGSYERPPTTYPKPRQGHYPYPENKHPAAGYGYSPSHAQPGNGIPMQQYHSPSHPQPGYGIPMQQYPPTYVPAAQNGSRTNVTVIQQPQSSAVVGVPNEKNYIPGAIAVTILCFFPLGVVAIFAAIKAREYTQQLKFDEAIKWRKRAKWLIWGCCLFGVLWILAVVVLIVWKIAGVYYMDMYKNCVKDSEFSLVWG